MQLYDPSDHSISICADGSACIGPMVLLPVEHDLDGACLASCCSRLKASDDVLL